MSRPSGRNRVRVGNGGWIGQGEVGGVSRSLVGVEGGSLLRRTSDPATTAGAWPWKRPVGSVRIAWRE